MLRVRVESPCRPTEDPAKVEAALLRLFPDLALEREDDRVVGTSSSLEKLRELMCMLVERWAAAGSLLLAPPDGSQAHEAKRATRSPGTPRCREGWAS